MTTEPVRADASWLALREPADGEARAVELVAVLAAGLAARRPARGVLVVHDLGSGTGAMARWLAPRLNGAQHWVLHDRDPDLLPFAATHARTTSRDGAPVTLETRQDDVTRLGADELADASLVTASALLDMLTAAELGRLVTSCAAAACPALITLSVTGRVELVPGDPLDHRVEAAFNAHQRRRAPAGLLLGPDAAHAAHEQFLALGHDVTVHPSPWRLGPEHAALAAAWFDGWVGAAVEQQPGLAERTRDYARRRSAEAAAGRLGVTVHHQDLLALPGSR